MLTQTAAESQKSSLQTATVDKREEAKEEKVESQATSTKCDPNRCYWDSQSFECEEEQQTSIFHSSGSKYRS
jgi:hypothetical protein